jgi:hypothetical protein
LLRSRPGFRNELSAAAIGSIHELAKPEVVIAWTHGEDLSIDEIATPCQHPVVRRSEVEACADPRRDEYLRANTCISVCGRASSGAKQKTASR